MRDPFAHLIPGGNRHRNAGRGPSPASRSWFYVSDSVLAPSRPRCNVLTAWVVRRNPASAENAITGMSLFSIFILVSCILCLRDLTSRAQARGADDVVRECGTGDAIPRCLQRFVRRICHTKVIETLALVSNSTSSQTTLRGPKQIRRPKTIRVSDTTGALLLCVTRVQK